MRHLTTTDITARQRSRATVQRDAVTATERRRSMLSRIDYEDAFLVRVPVDDHRTALTWAQDMLEGAPYGTRQRLRRVWTALGLAGVPTSSRTPSVLGWRISRQTPQELLLTAGSSWGLTGELLFMIEDHTLVFTTFARFPNPVIAAVWHRLVPAHERIVSRLLGRASATATPRHRSHRTNAAGQAAVVSSIHRGEVPA